MATTADLVSMGFVSSFVEVRRLNIEHAGFEGHGPFCRLKVETEAPNKPGVYVWVVNREVSYVGMTTHLLHVVDGTKHGRPYNDYSYIPPSQLTRAADPRARVNALINRAFTDGLDVSWWWWRTDGRPEAKRLEAELIEGWNPPWNIARPRLRLF